MHFRLNYTIPFLPIEKPRSIDFSYGGPHFVSVNLRCEAVDLHKGPWLCTAVCQQEPKEHIRTIFERIANNQLVPRSEMYREWEEYGFENLEFVGPQPYRSFVDTVQMELADYAKRTIAVLQWRTSIEGVPDPRQQHGRLEWSFDGQDWRATPGIGGMVAGMVLAFYPVHDAVQTQIENLVKNGQAEPLGHELFREAWSQRERNPRSALILGIAAAEVGFKQCIVDLVPTTQWLAENLPMPPLIQMLQEYLPILPAKCKIKGKVVSPPQHMIDTLKKGVQMRNRLVHRGRVSLEQETLKTILVAVRDLLWLFDYYTGFDWALDFIGRKTFEALESA